MDTDKDKIIAWLNDAYAMEMSLIPILENHASDIKEDNPLKKRIERHIDETKNHMQIIACCLERYDKNPSTIKATIGKVSSGIQYTLTRTSDDELVKNVLSDYTSESFEIVSYKALIVAATNMGDEQTVQACEQILRDEEDMAQFLDQNLKIMVNSEMGKHES